MKDFVKSKNFLWMVLIIGAVFLLIVVVQFVSIISLNAKNDSLNSKYRQLSNEEQYLNGVYNEASEENYSENFAKNEHNMKNKNETIYKGN